MRNLDFYINKAIEVQGFSSKRKLCAALGLSPNATTMYNNGSFPTDETMVKLAELSGESVTQALLELNIWRSPSIAQKSYINMLKKLTQTTACLALIITASSTAHAENIDGTHDHYGKHEYILSHNLFISCGV